MKNIKVFYWLGMPNFGDTLNITLCQKLFNVNPIETNPKDCDFTLIGSVLDDFLYSGIFKWSRKFQELYKKQPIKIWGSGFIADKNCFIKRKFNLPETYFRKFKCYAVRGKLSLDRLAEIDNTFDINNVVIGDPGLLISKLLQNTPVKKYKVGIIPHHLELDFPIWKHYEDTIPNLKIIRVDDDIEDIINQIAQCEVILSSAMHGLIAADSLNIPNARLIASDKLIGGDYKFNDYYSAFALKTHKKINIYETKINNELINSVIDDYCINSKQVDTICQNLIKSFPCN